MPESLRARHGIVFRDPKSYFGYFGWPTVARLPDGTLVVGASGFRHGHICPFGKTVLFTSKDAGKTWSPPEVVNDSPLDDRDVGLLPLGKEKLLVSWFTSDIRAFQKWHKPLQQWPHLLGAWEDANPTHWVGSFVRVREGGTWGARVPVSPSAPHGPIRLKGGDLFYFGKQFGLRKKGKLVFGMSGMDRPIVCARSKDGGKTWKDGGAVPLPKGARGENFHEPHAVELPSGKILGQIRFQDYAKKTPFRPTFSIFQTESVDGGKTWSEAKPTGVCGSPPHLLRHSSGTLIGTYGYRAKPYGERVMLSRDEGKTWETDFILRSDGPDGDLGYPSTVELGDGSLFTAYYQKYRMGEPCSLLWTRWRLPN